MKTIDKQTQDQYDLASQLVERAKEGVHTKSETIQNMASFNYVRTCRNAVYSVIQSCTKSAEKVFKDYLDSISNSQVGLTSPDFHLFILYKELCAVRDFYVEECNILDKMLDEYQIYIFSSLSNMISALLGYDRN